MKRIILLSISCLLLTFCATNAAAFEDKYTLEDGDTLEKDKAALQIYAGYPKSGFSFIAAPWQYVNIGFRLEMEYHPSLIFGVPFKVQLLESKGERLNFALTFFPGLDFNFKSSNDQVKIISTPGFAAGWQFIRGLSWFLSGEYAMLTQINPTTDFIHHPVLSTGLEWQTPTIINVIIKGIVEFKNYNSDDFVYGGLLGLGFAVW